MFERGTFGVQSIVLCCGAAALSPALQMCQFASRILCTHFLIDLLFDRPIFDDILLQRLLKSPELTSPKPATPYNTWIFSPLGENEECAMWCPLPVFSPLFHLLPWRETQPFSVRNSANNSGSLPCGFPCQGKQCTEQLSQHCCGREWGKGALPFSQAALLLP